MNRYRMLILAAWLVGSTAAFAQSRPAVELEAAIAKEQVNGDLKAAIAAYQKIANNVGAPRDVRAKALLHLAGCYEKQGQQAQTVYQQIVRDFADQPAAKQASAKLAAMRPESAESPSRVTGLRKVAVAPSLAGIELHFYNTDGRRAVYVDQSGILRIADLARGESRVVLKPKAGVLSWAHPSRDMSMVFVWLTLPEGKRSAVLMRTDGTGYREIPGELTGAPEWSWDNRYLMACMGPTSNRHPVRVTVADGTILPLRGTDRCLQWFSPDGRFLASRDVSYGKLMVGPADGGPQHVVADNAISLGWTRDGRYLTAVMNSAGSEGVYLIPMKDGERAGEAVLAHRGLVFNGKVGGDGSLVYETAPAGGAFDTWMGEMASDGRLVQWKPLPIRSNLNIPQFPSWSPDSSQFAYVASNKQAGQDTQSVRVRSVATGEERELFTSAADDLFCAWAKKHPKLFCGQNTADGQTEILSVSLESGKAERVGSVPGTNYVLFAGSDDQTLFLNSSTAELIRWDAATGKTAKLGEGRGAIVRYVTASPDGRWISRVDKRGTEIRAVSGGEWKPLIFGEGTEIGFTQDGNWLLYHDVDSAGRQSLFRVATSGGLSERIGDFPSSTRSGFLWVSPDWRWVVADAVKPREIWLLENFEPKQ